MKNNNVIDVEFESTVPKINKAKKKDVIPFDFEILEAGTQKRPIFRFFNYAIINQGFYQSIFNSKGEETQVFLCDFTCKIIEEITLDSGIEDKTLLRIEVVRHDGTKYPPVDVPNSKFISGAWVGEFFVTKLFVATGQTVKEHLRACIQRYSMLQGDVPSKTVYQYTGWKLIDDKWHYLTESGAITDDGLKENVNVDMGQGHVNRYSLPAPMGAESIKDAVDVIRDLLNICPDNKQIGAALFASIGRSVLGECSPVDYCLWLHGLTGSKKSAITSVALSFFGDFSGGVFPANWSDTEADMEAKSFQCKDGLFCVDDFKPSVNSAEAAKLHTKAERFIRNTGNQAGRGRRNNDMSGKAAFYNRSMTIITGEDLPRGQSLLGRLLILELDRNSVNCQALSRLQEAARKNVLSGLMSAYVQWLSSRIDGYKKTFPQNLITLRDEAIGSGSGFTDSHPRAALMYANMAAGADVFIEFLLDKGAVTPDIAVELSDGIHDQLKNAFKKQHGYISEQDEVERFLSLLRSLFSNGSAHLGNAEHQNASPADAGVWGWRCGEAKKSGAMNALELPLGQRIGWYSESDNHVYLDPNSAFSCVQEMARKQGDVFLMSQSTLWRRIGERGLFLRSEPRDDSVRYNVKRAVDGEGKPRVLVLSAETIKNSN